MNESSDPIKAPIVKAATALGSAWYSIHTWSDVAAFLSAIYAAVLLGEWAWKRFLRQVAVERGWIAPRVIADESAER